MLVVDAQEHGLVRIDNNNRATRSIINKEGTKSAIL